MSNGNQGNGGVTITATTIIPDCLPPQEPSFLKKFIDYAKKRALRQPPQLTEEALQYIRKYWMQLRDNERNKEMRYAYLPIGLAITVRFLEGLIRLSTAHAKLRLQSKVFKVDAVIGCRVAYQSLHQCMDLSKADEWYADFELQAGDGGGEGGKGGGGDGGGSLGEHGKNHFSGTRRNAHDNPNVA